MSVVLDSLRKLEADTAPVGAGQTGLTGERGGHATGETPALKDDTLSKLDVAVTTWTSQVDEAYTRLAHRIARLQGHINLQTAATAARESETGRKQAAALEAAEAHVQSLTQDVAQREEEVAAATQRIAQLKDEAAELTSEVLRLQKALDEQTFAYAQQQEDLERVRTALASARDQLTAARALSGRAEEFKALWEAERVHAARIEEQFREKDKEAPEASQKVKVLQERLDEITIENHKETAILRFEVEMLRRVNSSLSSPSPAKQDTVREKDATEDSDRERKRRMGEMLVGMGVITHDQLTAVLHEQTAKPQRRIGGILVERGYASEEVVAQVLARQMSLPFVRLVPEVVDAAAPRLINGQVAKRRQCIPITANADIVVLAMANPQDLIALDDVKFSSGRSVAPVVATGSDIAAAIGRYYGLS
jgi:regulator of replication initiation timing